MGKKPKPSPEELERQALLERYQAKMKREIEDRFIERMRAREEAEEKEKNKGS